MATYTRTYDWTDDRDASVPITASRVDTEMDGMVSALNNKIDNDGTVSMAADLAMGTHRITGLQDGTQLSNAATLKQAQTQVNSYAAAAGSSNAFTLTTNPSVTSYTTGQMFRFKANHNITGTATLNVGSAGAKTIKKYGSLNLATDDIVNGQIVEVVYDGTNFQMQNTLPVATQNGDFANATGSITPTTNVHTLTATGNITFVFTSVPMINGSLGTILIGVKQDGTGSRTVTWPASVANTPPTATTTAGKRDYWQFLTTDGGTSWRCVGSQMNQD